ncbi:hypothetical protein BDV19DRAFT_372664 [Aspergillus venezuelensis]
MKPSRNLQSKAKKKKTRPRRYSKPQSSECRASPSEGEEPPKSDALPLGHPATCAIIWSTGLLTCREFFYDLL